MEDVFTTVPDYNVFKELFHNKDFVSVEELWDMIEELHADKERLEEIIEDMNSTKEEDPYDRMMDYKLDNDLI